MSYRDLISLIENFTKHNNKPFDVFKIEELFEIERGKSHLNLKFIEKHFGDYPVYSAATKNEGIIGNINTYDYDGEYLTITLNGDAGYVFYRNNKFSLNSDTCVLKKKYRNINIKYCYFFLFEIVKKYRNENAGRPKLPLRILNNIPIIVPSIEIQNQIVEILEPLEVIVKNSKKLEILRQQQFNFYKNTIINFINNPNCVEKKNINRIFFNIFRDKLISIISEKVNFLKESIDNLFEIKKGDSKYTKNYIDKNKGEFPVYSGSIQNKGIIGLINTYDYDGEYLTWTTDGYAGHIFYRNNKFSMNCHCAWMKLKKQENNLKFFYYLLKNELKKYVNNSSPIPSLSYSRIKDILVIVPPIEIQNRLVQILDPFEQLVENTENLTSLYNDRYKYFLSLLLKLIDDVEFAERESLIYLFNFVFFSITNPQKICEDSKFNIEELFEFKSGRNISNEYIKKNKGIYPVYSSATLNNGLMGFINSFDFDGEYLTWTTRGYAGHIFYRNEKFNINSNSVSMKLKKKENNIKFFYYLLTYELKKYVKNSTIQMLKLTDARNIPIIVPPIEIQNKISQILEPMEQLLKNQVKLTFSYNKKYNFYKKNIIKLLLNGV